MLFWNNDYSRELAGHMRPVISVLRPASAQCCWLCHLSSDGLVESERHRSQKIYRSSEENRSEWVLFHIAIYRSSAYNPILYPAVSAELPGVLMFWNPTDARTWSSVSRMRADPDVLGVVNTAHRCDSQRISVSRREYYRSQYRSSILMFIDDLRQD